MSMWNETVGASEATIPNDSTGRKVSLMSTQLNRMEQRWYSSPLKAIRREGVVTKQISESLQKCQRDLLWLECTLSTVLSKEELKLLDERE